MSTKIELRLSEKYRPVDFEHIIGQKEVISKINNTLDRNEVVHYIFYGSSGTGKTTMAYIIARKLFGENWRENTPEYNSSDERKLETFRDKIIPALRTRGRRVIILDEADGITFDSQQALRTPMEKTLGTSLILLVNDASKITDALKSRAVEITFDRLSDDDVMQIISKIIIGEKLEFKFSNDEEKKKILDGIKYLVKSSNGDARKAINRLETIINAKKEITVENIMSLERPKYAFNALILAIEGKFFEGQRMVEDAYINYGFSNEVILEEFYDGLHSENIDSEVRIKLFAELKELDKNLKMTYKPLYQFVGFLAKAWIFNHLPKGCPQKAN